MAIDDTQGGGRSRRPDGGGARRSGARALVFWTVALLAGGTAALLLRWYMDRSAPSAPTPTAKVAVAARDLPIATALADVDVRLVDWPEGAQPSGVARDAKALLGRVLVTRVFAGEPILEAKLARKEGGRGLAALIPDSMRAVAVRVDEVVGVAGFVHPEDRVDVVVTIRTPTQDSFSKVVLQNVKVLAVGRDIDTTSPLGSGRNRAVPVTVATLLLTPPEVEKLALVSAQGKILLALRSWTDTTTVDTPGSSAGSLFGEVDALHRPRLPTAAAVEVRRQSRVSRKDNRPPPIAAPPVAATPQKEVVEILRGDRLEERKFDAKEKP